MRNAARFHITLLALLCLSTTLMVAAQTAKPEQKVTTLVGCLVQGNPGGANPNDYFVRTPTVAVPVGATIAVGKPGTTSTSTSSGTPTADSLYRITGLDREELRPHVGHRVELRGHLTAERSNRTTTRTTVDEAGRATTRSETRPDVVG